MKKKLAFGFIVLVGIMASVLSGCHSRPLLSEEGQNFCGLYQILNRIKIIIAELKGLIEAREEVVAEQEQILQEGKDLLEEAQAGQLIILGSVSYSQEQVSADLARWESQYQSSRQAVTDSKIRLGKLEGMVANLSKIIAIIKLKFNETEAIKAELMALADYQLVEVSRIRRWWWWSRKLQILLIDANSGFEAKLKQIQKIQQIDFFFPDVFVENCIPVTFWKRQVAVNQAGVEKNRENQNIVADWQIFWQKFGIQADLSAVKIPAYRQGFNRVLVIPQGLILSQAIRLCEGRFLVLSYYYDDLDKVVVKNDRLSVRAYAVRLRERQRADEELKNLSADDLAKKGIAGITLLERLIYELKYFDETGNHLDKMVSTLCCGSRRSDGDVPRVIWDDSSLNVVWCSPSDSSASLRSRAVVSCDSP